MTDKIKPISSKEIEQGIQIDDALALEVWFYAPSFEQAVCLMEAVLAAEFMSVKPSNLISSVQLNRPDDHNNKFAVIGRTGSQKVPIHMLSFFHEEMAYIAQFYGCVFGGSDLIGVANKTAVDAYHRTARQFGLSHTVFVH